MVVKIVYQQWHVLLSSIFLLFFLTFPPHTVKAQARRTALIIGINTYKPPLNELTQTDNRRTWSNLDGCINDASSIKDLVESRYGFPAANITTLFNEQASREQIITSLKKLVSTSVKGDVVFIYYAGHGSQVKNSLSKEADKKDETIVPADAWKKGVADIRDKELAFYFNQLLDNGVLLTVIFDSCHSGSVGRGTENFLNDPPKARFIEEAGLDAKDATEPQRPEERGALIISAAQDFEFAKEHMDENKISHGAFTSALLKALQQLSPDASVNDIFNSLTAIMKYYGKTQEPVLAASAQRKEGTLFDLPKGVIKNKFTVASSRLEAKGIELQGGYAFGLAEGVKVANKTDTLQVIEMRGANKSLAKVINGSKEKIVPGTLFEVVNWASSKAPALKVYIPKAIPEKQLQEYAKIYQAVRTTKKIKWETDLARANPDKIYYLENGQWNYNDKKEGKKIMAAAFTPASLQQSLGAASSAFVAMPPSALLYENLVKSFQTYNNIQVVDNANESQYTLVGVLSETNQLDYALVKSQVTLQDTTESLPARTDFFTYNTDGSSATGISTSLSEAAFKIAKIRDWLMLNSPNGANRFPFVLSFQGYSSGELLTVDKVKVGDTLSMFVQEDKEAGGWKSNFSKRYIYVFSIDSKGTMNLLFPPINSGNTENKFPVTDANNVAEKRTAVADFIVSEPAGADNYFLLSTEQAITNLSVFQQDGVLHRGPETQSSGVHNPLEDVLYTGSKTRSQTIITPVTWSIYKKVLRTHL
jgi:Caspase domain